jgi:hypothetical protein
MLGGKGVRGEKGDGVVKEVGDTVLEMSDGGQGLEESRAMLYTDSEEGSMSSFSNITMDSGIDSKATN